MPGKLPTDKTADEKALDMTQYALYGVAGASVLCALLRAAYPASFDETTAAFLVVAIVALVIQKIARFKGFGIEFEQLAEQVQNVQTAVGNLEKDVGPGSKAAVPPPDAAGPAVAAVAPVNPEDPNKGQFGGSASANGRQLTATIHPLAGSRSSRCSVEFEVRSTDPARPLKGEVKFHLHPTFGRWSSYDVTVKNGVAGDEIVSYGAFTIGAVADDGQTRLELDLMDVSGGTKPFYDA